MSRKRKSPAPTATTRGRDAERTSREQDYNIRNRKSCQAERTQKRMEREQIEKPGFWSVLPAAVRYDTRLQPNAKLLYAEISSLMDAAGYCFASNAYFERLFELSKRTIQNLLLALQTCGYIRIEDGGGGAQQRKIFAGINPLGRAPEGGAEICTGPVQKIARGGAKNCTPIDNKKNNNTPPTAPQGAEGEIWDPDAFAAFWALYPKKKDKVKAIREWNKLKADRKLMRKMSAALKTQMASEEWQRDNGRAIPYPCRWLSHRRWEDENTVTAAETPRREEALPEWI